MQIRDYSFWNRRIKLKLKIFSKVFFSISLVKGNKLKKEQEAHLAIRVTLLPFPKQDQQEDLLKPKDLQDHKQDSLSRDLQLETSSRQHQLNQP